MSEPLDRVLPAKEVALMLGISLTTLWRISNSDPDFPAKVQISERRAGWKYSDLLAYIDSRTYKGATMG